MIAVRPSRRWRRGQGIVEYGLILGLSALLAIGILVFAPGPVAFLLQVIADAVAASEGS